MKELQRIGGGYPRDMNYILDLQDELFAAQNGLFGSIPKDVVLSGCAVTDNLNGTVTIGPGLVYVNLKVLRFYGAANIPSDGTKAFVESAPATSVPVTFENNTVKNLYKEVKAVIGDFGSSTQIAIKVKLYSFKLYIDEVIASYGQKGETKWVVDLDGTFLTNFDVTGLGVTPRWTNWALMNDNNGAPSMAGRSPKGVGRFIDAYGLEHIYTNNQAGGQPRHKSTIPEMPVHNHPPGFTPGKGDGLAVSGGVAVDRSGTGGGFPNKEWTADTGGDQPHNNESGFRGGYWVIKIA
jgi:hypothetical protein